MYFYISIFILYLFTYYFKKEKKYVNYKKKPKISEIPRYKILYYYKGIQTPSGKIINDYIQNYNNRIYNCWYCNKSINFASLNYVDKSYISHQNLSFFQEEMLKKENKIMLCWNCAH